MALEERNAFFLNTLSGHPSHNNSTLLSCIFFEIMTEKTLLKI